MKFKYLNYTFLRTCIYFLFYALTPYFIRCVLRKSFSSSKPSPNHVCSGGWNNMPSKMSFLTIDFRPPHGVHSNDSLIKAHFYTIQIEQSFPLVVLTKNNTLARPENCIFSFCCCSPKLWISFYILDFSCSTFLNFLCWKTRKDDQKNLIWKLAFPKDKWNFKLQWNTVIRTFFNIPSMFL